MKDVYTVLSMDQHHDVFVICTRGNEIEAKVIVAARNKKFPNFVCWYQKNTLVMEEN